MVGFFLCFFFTGCFFFCVCLFSFLLAPTAKFLIVLLGKIDLGCSVNLIVTAKMSGVWYVDDKEDERARQDAYYKCFVGDVEWGIYNEIPDPTAEPTAKPKKTGKPKGKPKGKAQGKAKPKATITVSQ